MKHFKRREERTKPLLIAILCIMLVAVVSIGSTLAYNSASAGSKLNVFSFSENIVADLTEPNWNEDEGLKLVPGKKIDKDPMITNTSQMAEYAAIKLTFQVKDKSAALSTADYIKLMNLIVIDWNVGTGDTEWTAVSGAGTPSAVYVYNKELTPGEISVPIFNSIRVKTKADGLTEEQLRWLQGVRIENGEIVVDDTALGGLNIKVEGAVVHADGYESAGNASAALASLIT